MAGLSYICLLSFFAQVFHKIITTGHQCLQPLFDCLITIIDNVSPYVKSLSMISASKLMHLTEAFSQPWFLFSSPNNYQLVLFLLEIFNNIIQYQFDGNSCLVYSIIRKRQVFYQLANLPTTDEEIREILIKHSGLHRHFEAPPDTDEEDEVEDRKEEETTESKENESKPQERGWKEEVTRGTTKSKTEKEGSKGGNGSSRRRPTSTVPWRPTARWVSTWHEKLPLQTIMRLLQVLVPQVEKIFKIYCDQNPSGDASLKDEPEILKFLQNGTLVGLLPVPHPILIRKYQSNVGTTVWFRTYIWGVVYLRNSDPPIWFDTNVRLFEVQRT
ncbi:unnamed protein product [Hydatigera taeniaeformis]|uniref:HID1 domain containing b n=1 Tax=Hydatigena taeniaeformis TaxID=6205 RepID=A0A0R3WKE1_HYDTA|nr:unnamed protein product [Hydatigera taeniaeformis]